MSELELDGLTIEAWMREAAVEGGRAGAAPPTLVSLCPEDSLHAVAHALLRSGSGSLPMLSSLASPGVAGVAGDRPAEQRSTGVSQLLHLCTMSGVLACLMRHFRGVPNALSLLSQPLGALSIGTWTDGARREAPAGGVPPRPLVTMHPSTPLKTALAMLLQAGVGALPIVDDNGVLLDVYGALACTAMRCRLFCVACADALRPSQRATTSWRWRATTRTVSCRWTALA